MDPPVASFSLGMDNSPLGKTVAIHVYRREEKCYLGHLEELESIADMRERVGEDRVVQESEPEKIDFRFEIDESDTRKLRETLEDLYENDKGETPEPAENAICTFELYEGLEYSDEKTQRYKSPPNEAVKAFSELQRKAYERVMD